MRDLAAIAGSVATELGTEPILIIEVDWAKNGSFSQYADKDLGTGLILDVNGLDAVIQVGSTGASVSLGVVLDDTSNSIKLLAETLDFHKSPVKIYQTFEEDHPNKSLLFEGEVNSPIIWDEGNRTYSFEVLKKHEDKELGFSPEEGEFDFIADSAIGKAWPLCFGDVVRVPSVKLTEAVRGTSGTSYGVVSLADLETLCNNAAVYDNANRAKLVGDAFAGMTDENYEVLIDAVTSSLISLNTFKEALISDSPTQEAQIEAYIASCILINQTEVNVEIWLAEWIIQNNIVTSLEEEIPILQDELNALQAQIPIDPVAVDDKQEELFLAEAALSAATSLRFQAISQLTLYNTNLGIHNTTKDVLTDILAVISITEIIVECGEEFPQGVPVRIIINNVKFQGIFNQKVFTVAGVLPVDTNLYLGARLNSNSNEFWLADSTINLKGKYVFFGNRVSFVDNQEGTRCWISPILWEQISALPPIGGETREVFDELLLPSDGSSIIQETSGYFFKRWRDSIQGRGPDYQTGLSNLTSQDYGISIGDTVYLESDYKDVYIANLIPSTTVHEVFAYREVAGVQILVPVPSRYYTVSLDELIAGQNATTIRFHRPLGQYQDEGWGDEIYVSLTSSEGPNTSDIISYLLTTYTDVTINAGSFGSVNSALANYPSNFAYLERLNTFQAIDEISWQARCAVTIVNGVAFLQYLAAEQPSIVSITEADIENGTLQVTLTSTEDLVTKLTAEWKKEYTQEKVGKVVLRNNIPLYGLIEQTYDFYIYNIKSLVEKSLFFWMVRYSNTWKILNFDSFLTNLKLEVFDPVSIVLPFIADIGVAGHVQQAVYNSEDNLVALELWTAVRAGMMEQYVLAYPATAPGGTVYPTDDDLYAGGAG